jgi:hypothetical protein
MSPLYVAVEWGVQRMARLIDADALLAEYDRQHEGEPGKARKLIEDAPTIDRPTRSQFKRMAVQLGYEKVVHCKDCRLGDPDLSLKGSEQEVFCNYYDYPKPADGFCEKGKMKTYE